MEEHNDNRRDAVRRAVGLVLDVLDDPDPLVVVSPELTLALAGLTAECGAARLCPPLDEPVVSEASGGGADADSAIGVSFGPAFGRDGPFVTARRTPRGIVVPVGPGGDWSPNPTSREEMSALASALRRRVRAWAAEAGLRPAADGADPAPRPAGDARRAEAAAVGGRLARLAAHVRRVDAHVAVHDRERARLAGPHAAELRRLRRDRAGPGVSAKTERAATGGIGAIQREIDAAMTPWLLANAPDLDPDAPFDTPGRVADDARERRAVRGRVARVTADAADNDAGARAEYVGLRGRALRLQAMCGGDPEAALPLRDGWREGMDGVEAWGRVLAADLADPAEAADLADLAEAGAAASGPATAPPATPTGRRRPRMNDAEAERVAGELRALKRQNSQMTVTEAASRLDPPVHQGTLSKWIGAWPSIRDAWHACDSTPDAHARRARDG